MGINLNNKVSSDDVERIRDKRNPPEFEAGFEEEESNSGFSNLFDDIDFGDFDNSNSSSNSNGTSNNTSTSAFGSNTSSFGNTSSGLGTGNSGLTSSFGIGIGNQSQQQVQQKPSIYDKAFDATGEAIGTLGEIIMEAFKSIRLRTADDWGYYSSITLKVSLILIGISAALSIIGLAGGINMLKPLRMPLQLSLASILTLGTGLIGLGGAALYIEKFGAGDANNIESIHDAPQEVNDNYDEDLESLFGGIFDDDEEEEEPEEPEDTRFNDLIPDSFDPDPVEEPNEPNDSIDYNDKVSSIGANAPLINREFLFNTFKSFFPVNTPGFADVKDIDPDSDTFSTLETMCLKALEQATGKDFEDLSLATHMESASETCFTYELRIKRIKGFKRLEDLETEIEAYFRENSEDTSVSCKAELEGDFYKLTITKGTKALITLGDLLSMDKVSKYIKDEKNALPFVAGISETGQPIITDGKLYTTMLIAGKPRSGKSWYVLSIIWTMMVFNTPEDVQFLFIDPKESNLFKILALMPHVCGIHNDSNILKILRDLIDNEGARRKKLLADNKCENVWDLKKKGINIPILYIVIDEVMTIIANLGSNDKEFMSLMQIIITQLPSQGIHLIFVPHRAKGVITPTIRNNIAFTAAVRAENDVVCETLGIAKWKLPLLNPGDTALKMQGFGQEMLVHGPAVTTSDDDNTKHILSVAKAYYKMGIEIPDMNNIGCGYNRDMEYIKQELSLESSSNRVQFDLDEADNIDLDAVMSNENQ